MARLEREILKELILERLSSAVDPCALLTLEADLLRSVERASVRAGPTGDAGLLAEQLLRKAWTRLGKEALGKLCGACDDPT